MKVLLITSGLAAATLAFAYQDADMQDAKAEARGTESQDADLRSLEGDLNSVTKAYQSLHSTTLDTLNAGATRWSNSHSQDATGTDPDTSGDSDRDDAQADDAAVQDRVEEAPGPISAMRLDGEQLLFAACSKGLLAGAPSVAMKGGQTGPMSVAGMVLIGETPGSSPIGMSGSQEGQTREASSDEMAEARDAADSGRNSQKGAVKPGIYSVHQSGQSVILKDHKGQEVLRASLSGTQSHGNSQERKAGKQAAGSDETVRDAEAKNQERIRQARERVAQSESGGAPSTTWDRMFQAIAKEAMGSMGWQVAPQTK